MTRQQELFAANASPDRSAAPATSDGANEASGAEGANGANERQAILELTEAGVFADIDRHFGQLVEGLGACPAVALAATAASALHRAGHTCLELDRAAGVPLTDIIEQPTHPQGDDAQDRDLSSHSLPDQSELENALGQSPAVTVATQLLEDDEARPLVLENGRLYLQRLHAAECRVANRLLDLAQDAARSPGLAASIERAFGGNDERTTEATAAVRAAVLSRLSIVTGGPGTGKTTLVARILSALVDGGAAEPRRIALAAPTGKAAARLQESVQNRLGTGELLERVPALSEFPVEARTIHRLLASRTSLVQRLQALIVDECSMVDLPLMARLVGALPEDCRLILLGDANQLSSVEPGSVFSDLCRAGAGARLGECVTRLVRNYRFGSDSGIGRLAAAVVDGDGDGALATLRDRDDAETSFTRLDHEAPFGAFARSVADEWAAHMKGLAANERAADCKRGRRHRSEENKKGLAANEGQTEAFPARRVLCSHRRGPFGTNRFNYLVERRLTELRLRSERDSDYIGRPIIVTQNDRQTGLANGDAGIVVPGPDGGRRVWFPDRVRADQDDERFLISTARLPRHESYFALTVHRAQGSEYEEVVFVPGPAASRVNTRELFYTAVTRARRKVVVMATEDSVRAAAGRLTSRATGLLDRLR